MTIIAKRIATLRKQRDLSQEELAELIGTSQRQISYYETAKNEPTAGVIMSLAIALNTTTDYLLGLTDDPERPIRSLSDLDDQEAKVVKAMRSGDIMGAIKELVV